MLWKYSNPIFNDILAEFWALWLYTSHIGLSKEDLEYGRSTVANYIYSPLSIVLQTHNFAVRCHRLSGLGPAKLLNSIVRRGFNFSNSCSSAQRLWSIDSIWFGLVLAKSSSEVRRLVIAPPLRDWRWHIQSSSWLHAQLVSFPKLHTQTHRFCIDVEFIQTSSTSRG